MNSHRYMTIHYTPSNVDIANIGMTSRRAIFFVDHNGWRSCWRRLKIHHAVLFGPSRWAAESRPRPSLLVDVKTSTPGQMEGIFPYRGV